MCVLWGIAVFLGSALQCRPLAKYWDPAIEGKCFDLIKFVLSIQVVNVFLDTCILCLPMKMVWNLKRPLAERLALMGIFLLGGL
jgi:hypothetical protein